MAKDQSYYNYWGKADRDDPDRYHLLPYHCLDVAAVASVWWNSSEVIRRSFLHHSNLDEKTTKAWALFFISLHDYGKFDIRFQRKADHVREKLYFQAHERELPRIYVSKGFDHGSAGLYWFLRDNDERFDFNVSAASDSFDLVDDNIRPNNDWDLWCPWLEMVCGHHGFIHREEFIKDFRLPILSKPLALPEKKARRAWIECVEELFLHPCGLSTSDNPPQPSPLLAGFCSVSDWLGSRSDENHFHFLKHPISPKHYFRERSDDAASVLELSGIIGESRPYLGVGKLLPKGAVPRAAQRVVDDLPTECGLTIVEAPTGSGKTEMALAYAWRLLEKGLAESIIFALPTQATANKMLDRLAPLSVELFADHPNVLLAHGNARFNEKFISIKRAAQAIQDEGEGWAQCCEWLSQSRKRVFLGQIGVCTVDQVLISVLPVRHRFIRGFGTGRSVLIIDEVHAYDAYMYGLMQQVLKDQKNAGGSAILLSATLPANQHRALLKAWGVETNSEKEWKAYPSITWAAGLAALDFYPPEPLAGKAGKRSVNIEVQATEAMRPDPSILNKMIAAAEKGAQVALICNLVNDAQQIYQQIKQLSELPVLLFHARYTLKDRIEKENQVDRWFHKESDRTTGRILVGTQVLEQSLDYDVDWMITQLCPVDLLFQRMGRLHRHDLSRPEGFGQPSCTILLPATEEYGGHGLVYSNTLVMWRTAEKLSGVSGVFIVFPDVYREWIEEIYDENVNGDEPQWVLDGFEKYKEDLSDKHAKANRMIKWAESTWLFDTDQTIQAVTRDGEMSLQLTPFVQTGSGRELIDGRIVEKIGDSRIHEAIAVNSVNVPRSWEPVLTTIEKEDVVWLPMRDMGDALISETTKGFLTYTKELGLERKDK